MDCWSKHSVKVCLKDSGLKNHLMKKKPFKEREEKQTKIKKE